MDIPRFVRSGAFNWASRGYHYALDDEEASKVRSNAPVGNPWFEIAHVVERAKRGNFARAGSLSRFFDVALTTNAAPAAMLITGDLGRKADLQALVRVMREGPDGFRVYACQGARNAGCIWLVPHMLEAWHRSESAEAHEAIGLAIADLLEPISRLDEEGEIASRAGRFTVPDADGLPSSRLKTLAAKRLDASASEEFNDLVLRRLGAIAAATDDDEAVLWAGAATSVRAFAEHFLSMISGGSFSIVQTPLTVPLRHKFEASSGTDCSSFYVEGRFNQLAAVAVLEAFLDAKTPESFIVARRHFFGHPIYD